MPDTLTAPAPQPSAPPPATPPPSTPAPPATPAPESKGSDALAMMDSIIAPEPPKVEAPKEAAKEQPKDTKKEAPKVEAKTEPKPFNIDDPKVPAPELRKRLKEIEQEFGTHKLTASEKEQKLMAQIKAYEGREWLTPEQKQQQAAKEKQLGELQAQLYSMDYSQSPEYKDKFISKLTGIYKTAIGELKGMSVKEVNRETGDETQRPATKADFDQLRGYTEGESAALRRHARALFSNPDDADVAVKYVEKLNDMQRQADEEVENRRKSFDTDRQKSQKQMEQEMQEFDQHYSTAEKAIIEKYKDYFGDNPDDPELSAEWKKGVDMVETALREAPNMSLAKRAESNAILKMWMTSFPRNVATIKRLKAETSALQEELAKFRASDPGNAGETTKEATPPPEPKGSEDLAMMLEKMK